MKKFLAGVLAGVLISSTLTVFAVSKIKSANYNGNTVSLNGSKITLSQPLISVVDEENPSFESNYMPLRELLEKLGYKVEWQADKKNINLVKGEGSLETPTASITKAQIDKMLPVMDSIILSNSTNEKFNSKDDETFWNVLYHLVVNYSSIHPMVNMYEDSITLALRDKAVQELATGCFANYDDLPTIPKSMESSVQFDESTSEYVFQLSDRGDSYTKIDSYEVLDNKAKVKVSLLVESEDEVYGTFEFVLVPNEYADHVTNPIFELAVESANEIK